MKTIFNGYYKLTTDEFSTLWKNAIFIFDTNVLLNLYRYQTSTRDSLFSVVERLADRVWIPYHVGLEFQRNRLQVIADQHRRYSEVRNIVTKSISGMQSELEGLQLKKRHSHIDPDKLINEINSIKDEFLSELDSLEDKSISVNSTDTIRDRIDNIFEGKIGAPPAGQEEVDELFKEAEARYKCSIPPGFMDSKKDDKKPDEFAYGGITYKRKYGDILVWKQIIKEAKSKPLKDIIFITDDNKSDWWWQIDSNGKKTIGVRPELTDELQREAGVERFYVYNTEGFLSYANEQLNAQVTEEAIEEVREVSVARLSRIAEIQSFARLARSAKKSAFEWLSSKFSSLEGNRLGFPDFVGYQDDLKFGFEVKVIREPRFLVRSLNEMIHQAYFMLNENDYHEVVLILVVFNEDDLDDVLHIAKSRMPKMKSNLRVLVGKAEFDEEESTVYAFTPYDDIRSSHSL